MGQNFQRFSDKNIFLKIFWKLIENNSRKLFPNIHFDMFLGKFFVEKHWTDFSEKTKRMFAKIFFEKMLIRIFGKTVKNNFPNISRDERVFQEIRFLQNFFKVFCFSKKFSLQNFLKFSCCSKNLSLGQKILSRKTSPANEFFEKLDFCRIFLSFLFFKKIFFAIFLKFIVFKKF